MNKYGSNERRIWAKAIVEAEINPPSDLVFPVSASFIAGQALFLFPQEWLNHASIIRVCSIGLFSNFADGLVYKRPSDSIQVLINSIGANDDAEICQSGGMAQDTKILSGTGFTGNLSQGDFIRIFDDSLLEMHNLNYLFRIAQDPTDDNNVELGSYPLNEFTDATITRLQTVTGSSGASKPTHLNVLNTMHPFEYVIDPLNVSSTQFSWLILQVNFRCTEGLTFLTKSVSTSYAEDTAFFDVAADIEITGA